MELVTGIQILDVAVCVSLHTNVFEKDMNQSVFLFTAIGN